MMRWAKHVASGMGEMRSAYKISARTLAEKIPCGSEWIGYIWLRIRPSGGLL
jgi:hypothetical protein